MYVCMHACMYTGPAIEHDCEHTAFFFFVLLCRETLKASGDEVHAALRDAELRVGQALSSGDAARRDADAARAEVRTLCVCVCVRE